jgi:N-acetylglucosamine-6-sulfatase
MKNFNSNLLSSILLTAPLLQSLTIDAEPKSGRPNIIFVLVDDLRWDAMGFTGKYPFLKTPNIDHLRAEGVHFQNAFCTHSLCAPSRATILTGMFPQTNGVSTNQEGREFNPDKTPSFAQILQNGGYATGFIGKWHMAESDEPRKGFDYWCSFSGQGNYDGNNLNINGKIIRNEGYITDELNKYALDFVDKNADKPFCLYLSHKAVHQPFTPAERDKDLYTADLVPEPAGWRDNMENKPAWQRVEPNMEQRLRLRDKDLNKILPVRSRKFGPWPAKTGKGEQKNYLRCLSAVDDGLGEIYDLLRKNGILDNTVLVFAGDNGFFHGEHGKGDKRLAYNESMRIPLVMRYPGMAKAGSTVSEMVLNADIAPTFLDMAGVAIPAQMQGKSVVPLLHGKNEGWRKSFLFTYWPDLICFIPRITAIRTERYLYSTTPDLKDIDELYDEQADPAELNNLAENPNFSDLKSKLSKELELLKKETGYRDDIPRPDPEPAINLKTGKLFSVDFGKISFDNQPGEEIHFTGIEKADDQGKIYGSFQEGASAVIAWKPELDPSLGTFVIDCVIKTASPDGVIASCGSQKDGWALFVEKGLPGFVVAHNQHLQFVDGLVDITGKRSHLVAVIENYNNVIKLYADGKLIGQRQMLLPIQTINNKAGAISLGQDANELIDPNGVSQHHYQGLIQQINFYREKMSDARIKELTISELNQQP